MKVNAVDLFCGSGGLTRGLIDAGINVVAGIDIEPKCKFPYEYNNHVPFFERDIKHVSANEIDALYPTNTDIRLLAGCAPCQPFSSYSYRYKDQDHTRNKMDLLAYFGKLVVSIQPEIVSMENVPQLEKEPIFQDFVGTLSSNGYHVTYHVVYAPAYGVPQNRKRLVLFASKKMMIDIIPPLYSKENYPTVRQTIGNLPPIRSGETSPKDPMHRAVKLNETNLERIKASSPGGTWHDWKPSLILKAYKKKSGRSYTSIYGRMEWDKPAPTITTKYYGYGNGRFGHPDQDRAISYREGALLQTFPLNYVFFDANHPVSTKELGIMIGNAVPVQLAKAIGISILQNLEAKQ
ncbi:cytosine methyl transferase [Lacticaseibacillus paracasei subsp. paracasei Lpp71]|uniref:DNA (cytosine-5-)-methyltransferase n=1 Tax=Lacticaseibacillus paracasei subsp. paracasei Lpp71 TaxID=1256207 RepID=A0A8E0ISE8_LACPA|nr:cytosine methyl transferase [Lacticaseibacillus paracasei subsp. paracasei Lpp71]